MTDPNVTNLGPLAPLAGTWEGAEGRDVAPSADRGVEESAYRERLVLEPIGCVTNHEQCLYGLRYSTVAWRIGEEPPFHEEVGYWLWDAERSQVMRTFLVPRGVSVMAGGTVAPDADTLVLRAELGSPTWGICSNPFLHDQFRVVGYEVTIRIEGPDRFAYEEDTRLLLAGREDVFHHTDRNILTRVS